MIRKIAFLFACVCVCFPAIARAAADPTFFRLYLADGTSVVSYGEFARVDDRIVFSMVLGGPNEPRLQAATLPVAAVDWDRTDRGALSTRYQWYARKIRRAHV